MDFSPHFSDISSRIIANANNESHWLDIRKNGITATDAAKLSTEKSIDRLVQEKRSPTPFAGNVYTKYGKAREPYIAQWAYKEKGFVPSSALFHAQDNKHHLATPDAILLSEHTLVLAEFKTSTTDLTNIPKNYLRQIWWQQYVLGASHTLFVWEEHKDFIPVHKHPRYQWVERNEYEIELLKTRAQEVLLRLLTH